MDGISTFSALLSAGRNPGHVHWLSLSNAERHGSLSQPSDLGECPLSIAEGLPKAISMQEAVVFQKWRWPLLYYPSKGISVDKQANDEIVHLCRFRKTDGLAHQALDTRP
jgi:hypothetical protein